MVRERNRVTKGYKLWEDHAQAGSRLRITTELHHLKSEVQLQKKKTESEKMDGRSWNTVVIQKKKNLEKDYLDESESGEESLRVSEESSHLI